MYFPIFLLSYKYNQIAAIKQLKRFSMQFLSARIFIPAGEKTLVLFPSNGLPSSLSYVSFTRQLTVCKREALLMIQVFTSFFSTTSSLPSISVAVSFQHICRNLPRHKYPELFWAFEKPMSLLRWPVPTELHAPCRLLLTLNQDWL